MLPKRSQYEDVRRALKGAVKDLLAARGLEIHRTRRGVRRSADAVLDYYTSRGLAPVTIVDVGVASGTPGLYEPFPGARRVLVEPLAEWREHLEQQGAAAGCQVDVVTAAAGRAPGSIAIDVHRVLEMSSVVGSRPGDASDSERRTVAMVTLDSVAEDLAISGPVLLKIDVEGAEMEVLAGATALLEQCDMVLIELTFVELIEGQPLFGDVVSWMLERGFVVADFYDGHNRPLDGALAVMDVAFLPVISPLRSGSGYATASGSEALYRSWGV